MNTTNEVLVLRGLLVYRERNNKQDDTKHLIIIARRRTIRGNARNHESLRQADQTLKRRLEG